MADYGVLWSRSTLYAFEVFDVMKNIVRYLFDCVTHLILY